MSLITQKVFTIENHFRSRISKLMIIDYRYTIKSNKLFTLCVHLHELYVTSSSFLTFFLLSSCFSWPNISSNFLLFLSILSNLSISYGLSISLTNSSSISSAEFKSDSSSLVLEFAGSSLYHCCPLYIAHITSMLCGIIRSTRVHTFSILYRPPTYRKGIYIHSYMLHTHTHTLSLSHTHTHARTHTHTELLPRPVVTRCRVNNCFDGRGSLHKKYHHPIKYIIRYTCM